MDYLNVEKITKDDEYGRIIHDHILSNHCEGYVLVGEDRMCIPKYFTKYAEQIKNFEVKDDDVWVASYPKTGTTWTQEMVWMIANNLDYEGAKVLQHLRFPFLEISGIYDQEKENKLMKIPESEWETSVETAARQKSPRFIKTHLPYSLLPEQIKNGTKTPKIVYVMRNPKDACVSFYHHGILLEGWNIDLENYAKLFMADRGMYGSYWKNIFGYWEHRNDPNILIIKFEDMKADLPSVIKKVAKFLEKDITEEQVEELAKYLSFDSIRKNEAVNKVHFIDMLKEHRLISKDGVFIRSGKVGKYKEELSLETIKRFDDWVQKNIAGTSLENDYIFNL